MKTATKKLRSPLKWHGGKTYLARRIIGLFPAHDTYVEPFLGGGSILLNKPRAEHEIVGDLNGDLIWFWLVLQGRADEFQAAINAIPYSEASWVEWTQLEILRTGTVDRSVEFIISNRFSRGGMGKDFAWSDRLRGGQPGDVNAWDTIRREMPRIVERIKGVEFRCGEAIELISENDGPGTLFYIDPPYLPETRTARKVYDHEMSVGDHEELLGGLVRCEGKVFLSGYQNPLYDTKLAGWTRHEFSMPNHSGQGKTKQRRIECVWTNVGLR